MKYSYILFSEARSVPPLRNFPYPVACHESIPTNDQTNTCRSVALELAFPSTLSWFALELALCILATIPTCRTEKLYFPSSTCDCSGMDLVDKLESVAQPFELEASGRYGRDVSVSAI